jgi:hypothetical protein
MREKSLVTMCSEISGNSRDISKAILQISICRFESWRPSQPVSGILAVSGSLENARQFRGLAWDIPVSATGRPDLAVGSRDFQPQVSGRDFSISNFLILETRFDSTETGSILNAALCDVRD